VFLAFKLLVAVMAVEVLNQYCRNLLGNAYLQFTDPMLANTCFSEAEKHKMMQWPGHSYPINPA
jgi:hypothetical protein